MALDARIVSKALCKDGTDDDEVEDAGGVVVVADTVLVGAAAFVVTGVLPIEFPAIVPVLLAVAGDVTTSGGVSVVVTDGLPIQCKTLPFSNLYSVITFIVVSVVLSVINRPR